MRALLSRGVLLVLFMTNVQANICLDFNLPESEHYTFHNNIKIKTDDGLYLMANVLEPSTPMPAEGYPTVIFANSWLLEEHEYIRPALELVKKGIQVFSYSTRGWGCSEGLINVLGPKDMNDLNRVVDWIEKYTKTDMKNIGMSGISYGGGLTLMGLAHEPRIKTGVAMSAWGSLEEALYANETPRLFWGSFLVSTGWLTGELDPVVFKYFLNIILKTNIQDSLDWVKKRSPITYIEKINKRKAPVYIANNYGDNLFQPNDIINYFNKLKGPKLLDLNQGMHATGEGSGLFTKNNYTFKKAMKWFEYWLLGKNNGILNVSKQVSVQTDLDHHREYYPNTKFNSVKKSFSLAPRGLISRGGLLAKNLKNETDSMIAGIDSGLSTGIPLLSALIDGNLKIPSWDYLPITNRLSAIVYKGERLKEKMSIRGNPRVNLTVKSSKNMIHLVAYLYEVNSFGLAKLITHGVKSLHNTDENKSYQVNFDLVTTAYDLEKGSRLVLAFDSFDPLYSPGGVSPYFIDFIFNSETQQLLELPLVE